MQDWILAVICILSPVALCIVGVRYVHKVFSTEVLARHNDIAAPLRAPWVYCYHGMGRVQ
jgi:hypothetical protein